MRTGTALRSENRKIYKKRRPVKTTLKVFGILLAALIVLFIVAFFSFQRYIVYTPDGPRLEIPIVQRYRK